MLRFGRWIDTTQPGLHVHLPYPIDTVLLPKVTQINQVQLGNPGVPGDPASGRERQMLTGDENIVEADCAVFWKIRDAGEFLFRVNAPEAAVKIAAEGALRDVISRTPIQAAMSDKRQQIADETKSAAPVAARCRARRHRDHSGPTAARRAAAGGDRRVQRRAARARRSGALAQRGRGLRQRHSAARARRRGAHPPGRGSLQDPDRQPRPGRRQRFPTPSTRATSVAKDVTAWRLYLDSVDEMLRKATKVILDTSGKGVSSVVPYMPVTETRPRPSVPPSPAPPTVLPSAAPASAAARAAPADRQERCDEDAPPSWAGGRRRPRRLSRRLVALCRPRGRAGAGRPPRRADRRRRRARPESQGAVHRQRLRLRHATAAAGAAARADDPGRPEAARGATLHALPHRRSRCASTRRCARSTRRARSLRSS